MRKPSRILLYGDYGPGVNTGFATVLTNIKKGIKTTFGPDVMTDVCGINYHGDLFKEPDDSWVCSARQTAVGENYDDFGRIGFAKLLKQSTERDEQTGELMGYDGIFILNDLNVILPYVPLYREVQGENARENKRNFKSIFYFPVDCEYNAESLKGIDFFDAIITYNDFGKREIIKHRPDLRAKISAVPHGVDTKKFYPLSADQKKEFREKYFGKHASKFIIANINRNQHRKDIPATFFAFMEYKKKNPNAFLYLHMAPIDHMGWDLRAFAWGTGLKEGKDFGFPPKRVVQVDGKDYDVYDTDIDTLNKIYNACDVYLTTTRGEGWGLSVTESMACRLPVICPLNTSLFEITDNGRRAYVLENQYPVASRADNIIRGQIDPDEAAATLDEVCTDLQTYSGKLTQKVDAAYNYALSLSWDDIAKRWAQIFKKVY